MNSFRSLTMDQKIALGVLANSVGVRPSQLFDWNDPEDLVERLQFDFAIMIGSIKYWRTDLIDKNSLPKGLRR